ncbi:MAG: acyl--CoA ligase [Lachnospiraceae bacterium]|nr:acyl--CoA ligase [Lachnospiraceae bacterium]
MSDIGKMMEELQFSKWLECLVEFYGDRPAYSFEEVTLSYRRLYLKSVYCADKLIRAGLKRDDKVVLWAMNSADWLIAYFGITMAGGVAVLMNYGLNAVEVSKLTEMVGATWAVVGPNKVSLKDAEEADRAMVLAGVPAERVICLSNLADPAKLPDEGRVLQRLPEEDADPRDTRIIIFTTGTTATPKAVQLSTYAVLNDAFMFSKRVGDDMTDRVGVALPMFHSFGMTFTLSLFMMGFHVWSLATFKPQNVMDMIVGNRITTLATVGAVCSGMTFLPGFEETVGELLKSVMVGGGLTAPSEMIRIEKMLHRGCMLVGYGQTECAPIVSVSISADPLERRSVSVGRTLPGMEVQIWKKDAGILGCGEIGEIVVKGPNTMNGYLGLPQEQQPFDADGWLHTGDLGMISEDGFLTLTGRIKDIIIRGGENISPIEIENALLENPAIRDAKVFGAPHPIMGESVEACIVTRSDSINEELLRENLIERLSSFKIPSHFFIYEEFPLDTNGKLAQRVLKNDMLEKLQKVVDYFLGVS